MANETKIRQTELDVTLNNILTQLSGLTNAGTTSTTFTLGNTTPSAGNIINLRFSSDVVNPPTFRWNGNTNSFEYGIGGTFLAFSTIATVTTQKGVKNTGTVNAPVLEADFGSGYNKTTEAVHLSSGDSSRTHGGYLSSVLVTDSAGNVKGEPFRTGILHLREGGGVTLTHQDDNMGVPSITVTAGGIGTLRVPPSAGISGDLTFTAGTGIAIVQGPTGFTFSNTGLSSISVDGTSYTNINLLSNFGIELQQFGNDVAISLNSLETITGIRDSLLGNTSKGEVRFVSSSNELSVVNTPEFPTNGALDFTINSMSSDKISWTPNLIPLSNIPTLSDSNVSSLNTSKLTGTISNSNLIDTTFSQTNFSWNADIKHDTKGRITDSRQGGVIFWDPSFNLPSPVPQVRYSGVQLKGGGGINITSAFVSDSQTPNGTIVYTITGTGTPSSIASAMYLNGLTSGANYQAKQTPGSNTDTFVVVTQAQAGPALVGNIHNQSSKPVADICANTAKIAQESLSAVTVTGSIPAAQITGTIANSTNSVTSTRSDRIAVTNRDTSTSSYQTINSREFSRFFTLGVGVVFYLDSIDLTTIPTSRDIFGSKVTCSTSLAGAPLMVNYFLDHSGSNYRLHIRIDKKSGAAYTGTLFFKIFWFE